MNFVVDIFKLAKWTLNPNLYLPKQWRWVKVFIVPLKTVYNTFTAYRADVIVRLRPNSQTIVMETLLNNLYDADLRRIYIITESDRLPRNIFYTYDETEHTDSESVYRNSELPEGPVVYRYSEYALQSDFSVNVPASLSDQESEIAKTVNNYRLRTKFFIIKYF